jgi:hypothetical protein
MLLPLHTLADGLINFVCHDINDNFAQVCENLLVTLIYLVNEEK